MNLGILEIVTLVLGIPLGLLLAALLLKAACDVCSVEPPVHYFRCLIIVIVLQVLTAPLAFGLYYAGKHLPGALGVSETSAFVLGLLAFLPVSAVVSTIAYVLALRVGPLKGAKVWLVQNLINAVVTAVGVLLVIGCWTTVDSIRRLF